MLQTLNSRIQGWFAWIIISAIALTFALFGVEHYIQSRAANLAKAEVNGHVIPLRDFDLNYRRNQSMHEGAPLTAAAEQQYKQELVDEMIKKNLALQSALSNGFQVTHNQVLAAIENIPQFQEEGHFSVRQYQQALSHAMFTPESFRTEVWEGLLLNQQKFAFTDTAFALPDELTQFVKLFYQTRDYQYLVIPVHTFIENITIDDKTIEAYYQHHHQAFKTPETVSVDYVRLSMPELREKITVSEKDIQRYYEDNKSNYNKPAKWHAAHIFFAAPPNATPEQWQQVEQKAADAFQLLKKTPGEFEHLVQTQSDDKFSVAQSGVLPWITAGQSQFDNALVNLTTVNELSAPIKTPTGYEIFKLLAYKPVALQPFDSVKQQIKNQLISDKVQTDYSHALEQLSDLAYQTPDTLDPIADSLHLTIQHSESFAKAGGTNALTQNKKVLQAAFSHEVMTQGNNSEPIQIDPDTVIVLRVMQHQKASEQSLPEVKTEISQLLSKQHAEAEAHQLGQTILKLQGDKTKEQELVDQYHFQWQDMQHASRQTETTPAAINELAFRLGKNNTLIGDTLGNGDYVLIRVLNIADGKTSELTEKQINNLGQKLATNHGVVAYELYMHDLMKQAKIKKY